jgi:hypothetical protein
MSAIILSTAKEMLKIAIAKGIYRFGGEMEKKINESGVPPESIHLIKRTLSNVILVKLQQKISNKIADLKEKPAESNAVTALTSLTSPNSSITESLLKQATAITSDITKKIPIPHDTISPPPPPPPPPPPHNGGATTEAEDPPCPSSFPALSVLPSFSLIDIDLILLSISKRAAELLNTLLVKLDTFELMDLILENINNIEVLEKINELITTELEELKKQQKIEDPDAYADADPDAQKGGGSRPHPRPHTRPRPRHTYGRKYHGRKHGYGRGRTIRHRPAQ